MTSNEALIIEDIKILIKSILKLLAKENDISIYYFRK
mgnify:CR=1 FL=1